MILSRLRATARQPMIIGAKNIISGNRISRAAIKKTNALRSVKTILSLRLCVIPHRDRGHLVPRPAPQVASKVLTKTAESAEFGADDRTS
jgi:hypothetical protein